MSREWIEEGEEVKKERWKKTDGMVGFEKKERKRRNERRLIKMKEGWEFGKKTVRGGSDWKRERGRRGGGEQKRTL